MKSSEKDTGDRNAVQGGKQRWVRNDLRVGIVCSTVGIYTHDTALCSSVPGVGASRHFSLRVSSFPMENEGRET